MQGLGWSTLADHRRGSVVGLQQRQGIRVVGGVALIEHALGVGELILRIGQLGLRIGQLAAGGVALGRDRVQLVLELFRMSELLAELGLGGAGEVGGFLVVARGQRRGDHERQDDAEGREAPPDRNWVLPPCGGFRLVGGGRVVGGVAVDHIGVHVASHRIGVVRVLQ